MYKKYTNKRGVPKGYVRQILLIMRLTTLILITAILQVSASSFAQKVTISERNASLIQVLDRISVQTGYDFLYESTKLKNIRNITVNVKNAELADVLNQILEPQRLVFSIEDNSVVIKEKAPTYLDNLISKFRAIDVRGKVVGEEDEILIGATVKVIGTNINVSTDAKGEFFLEKIELGAKIVISYLGYLSQEVEVKENVGIIKLQKSISQLEEVTINKGYYSTTKTLNTGTVSTLTAQEINKQPVANPLAALQGRLPGVFITQLSGLPGTQFTVQIRGRNSIQSGNEPLYVVDGVIYSSDNQTRTGSNNVNNAFSTLVPTDIERVDVLKDGDATSIYGSR
ncbi:MAG: SusC/RagA family TonB-linked outer membrane protein, partial [Sphingobacteriales bacterium]